MEGIIIAWRRSLTTDDTNFALLCRHVLLHDVVTLFCTPTTDDLQNSASTMRQRVIDDRQ
jgi:hypothetical protein